MKEIVRNPNKVVRSSSQLGQMIRQHRKAQGLSQSDLAKKAGIAQPTLSEFETDPKKSRIETALLLLSALGLEIQINEILKK